MNSFLYLIKCRFESCLYHVIFQILKFKLLGNVDIYYIKKVSKIQHFKSTFLSLTRLMFLCWKVEEKTL